MDPQKPQEVCCWCGEPALICCHTCGEIWYCSKEHQREHWKEHCYECNYYRIENSPQSGQYLVASRKMKAGTVILWEKPIIMGPLGRSDLICLTCHSPIYEDDFFKCPMCLWPMCSLNCASNPLHDDECYVLAEDKNESGVPQGHGETPRYDLIMILRCLLLRKTEQKMWTLVQKMVSHADERKEEQEPHHMAAVRYFTEICCGDWDKDTIHHVRGVILTNSIEIRGPNGSRLRALYPTIRLLNHSCLPNVQQSSNNEGEMTVRAAVDIMKKEPLFISYCGVAVPIWDRQSYLSSFHYFNCMCQRCSDPSELGTMFSSAKCPFCPQAAVMPTVSNGNITWACTKCGAESSLEDVKQEIEEWTFRLEMNELFGTGTPYKISHALAVIEQQFHRKHYMWLKTAQAALFKTRHDSSFSAQKLKKYIWEQLLDIYTTLEPGLTRRRGMTLLELANVTLGLADPQFLENGDISIYQVELYMTEAKFLITEGHKHLRTEPQGTVERRLADSIPPKLTLISEELQRTKENATTKFAFISEKNELCRGLNVS